MAYTVFCMLELKCLMIKYGLMSHSTSHASHDAGTTTQNGYEKVTLFNLLLIMCPTVTAGSTIGAYRTRVTYG